MSVIDTLTEDDVESLLDTIDMLESGWDHTLLRSAITPEQAERLGRVMLAMDRTEQKGGKDASQTKHEARAEQ